MLHCLRMGTHAEKKFIKDYKNSFDTLIVNANIVAHTLDSMAAFLGVELKRKFVIDPQTYAFQNRELLLSSSSTPENEKLKVSILKLIEKYGPILKSILVEQGRSVVPNDFSGEAGKSFQQELCAKVLCFQENEIKSSLLNNEAYGEYIQFLNKNTTEFSETPVFVIAPYFYMQIATLEEWLPINIECVNVMGTLHQKENIAAQIVLNQDILLDSASIKKIVEAYSNLNIKKVLLWVDDLHEQEVSVPFLNGFVELIKGLKSHGKEVVNLYGGYFSLLLTKGKRYLDGVCNGMEYGEHRAVFPVGGGIPRAKFYLPSIHNRLLYRTVLDTLFHKKLLVIPDYYSKVCSCQTCHELLKNDPADNFIQYGESDSITFSRNTKGSSRLVSMSFPTVHTKENCLRHYLNVKQNEWKKIEVQPMSELIGELDGTYAEYEKELGASLLYLRTWKNILAKLSFD